MANEIIVKRGDTLKILFKWMQLDVEGKPDPTKPINLTGCNIHMQFRDRVDAVFVDLKTGSPKLINDGATGHVHAWIDTDEVPVGVYYTDMEVTYPDTTIQSSATFTVNVIKDITRVVTP